MYKKLFLYSLLISILAPLVMPWVTMSYFELNREYIRNNLCINRSKPMLSCNGKCFLAKKLKQQQENEQHTVAGQLKMAGFVPVFFNPLPDFRFDSTLSLLDNPTLDYCTSLLGRLVIGDKSRPPEI